MAYVYQVKHRETGEFYIGSKYAIGATPDNTKDYFGTSKGKTTRCIRYKHLVTNEKHLLDKIILGIFDTKQDALQYEIEMHNKLFDNPLCLNGAKQTSNKFSASFSGKEHQFFGKKHSKDAIEKMRLAKLGKKQKPYSEQAKANRSAGQRSKKLSDEHKYKLRLARLGKTISKNKRIICPHCNKEGGASGMKRYHFDNCKFKEQVCQQ